MFTERGLGGDSCISFEAKAFAWLSMFLESPACVLGILYLALCERSRREEYLEGAECCSGMSPAPEAGALGPALACH